MQKNKGIIWDNIVINRETNPISPLTKRKPHSSDQSKNQELDPAKKREEFSYTWVVFSLQEDGILTLE